MPKVSKERSKFVPFFSRPNPASGPLSTRPTPSCSRY